MKNIILLFSLFCTLLACKRDYEKSKLGPEVIIVPESFTVNGFTTNPSNAVNLAKEEPYFTATLPQRAEFLFIIKGLSSGAIKFISGAGDFIDSTNSAWSGDSDNDYMFRKGEKCAIELAFHGATKKYYDTITVVGENIYAKTTVINNFEGVTVDKNYNGSDCGVYDDTADFKYFDIYTNKLEFVPQGSQCINYDGVDKNNSYFIAGMYFLPSYNYYNFAGYNLDSLYINAYIYSYDDNSTLLSISVKDDDSLYVNYSDKVYDDEFSVKDIAVDGSGWKLWSMPLKKFTDNNSIIGNGILNTDRIKAINVNFNAKTAGTRARVKLDYITVTYGKPFNP